MNDIKKIKALYPIGQTITIWEDDHRKKYTVQRYIIESQNIYIEMLEDARRFHVDRLQEMQISEENLPTVIETLSEVSHTICDQYCKYPMLCHSDEELADECLKCPLCQKVGV